MSLTVCTLTRWFAHLRPLTLFQPQRTYKIRALRHKLKSKPRVPKPDKSGRCKREDSQLVDANMTPVTPRASERSPYNKMREKEEARKKLPKNEYNIEISKDFQVAGTWDEILKLFKKQCEFAKSRNQRTDQLLSYRTTLLILDRLTKSQSTRKHLNEKTAGILVKFLTHVEALIGSSPDAQTEIEKLWQYYAWIKQTLRVWTNKQKMLEKTPQGEKNLEKQKRILEKEKSETENRKLVAGEIKNHEARKKPVHPDELSC